MPIDKETIARLRRLHEGSTKGQWADKVGCINTEDTFGFICCHHIRGLPGQEFTNAACIAETHNALPALLDRVEELERENDELRSILDELSQVPLPKGSGLSLYSTKEN